MKEYPTAPDYPYYITAGPDRNLWFTTPYQGTIGVVTTSGSVLAEYPVPGYPWEIVAGPDGNLWYTDWETSSIGKITTDGTITEYPTPTQYAVLAASRLAPTATSGSPRSPAMRSASSHCTSLRQFVQLRWGEFHVRSRDVFVEMRDRRGARNGQHRGRPRQEPG